MASIRKRGVCYYVIHNVKDLDGNTKQIWESGYTHKEAIKRKAEIEYKKSKGLRIQYSNMSFKQFVEQWLPTYAVGNWQFGTYSSSESCVRLHVLPSIGDVPLHEVTPRMIEELIGSLYTKKIENHSNTNRYLSSSTIRIIYVLLSQIFNKAVEWEYIEKSPVRCKAPKKHDAEQNIWNSDAFSYSLRNVENPILYLAIHLSFVCSLRVGELLAITLDDIDLFDKSIMINKTIQRVDKQALKSVSNNSIIKIFRDKVPASKTSIVLKTPKTKSSVRKVFLSQPLIDELQQVIAHRKTSKDLFRWPENHNLLFCFDEDGSPITPHLCRKWFKLWQSKNAFELPNISFHGIRHSSSTYKLLLSNGNYKAVQGDTGHASTGVLMDIYAHIQDEPRRDLMAKFEVDFYR